jgi:hypothetical protein
MGLRNEVKAPSPLALCRRSPKRAGVMECGGKRSATPLWLTMRRRVSGMGLRNEVKAPSPLALCRRSPKRAGAHWLLDEEEVDRWKRWNVRT